MSYKMTGSRGESESAPCSARAARQRASHVGRSRMMAYDDNNDDNNNNNSRDNVYGAVIMTEVIARVHPVNLMNAD